jgi:hypothetical protein
MKAAGPILLCLVAAVTLPADEPAAPPATSDRLKGIIRAGLPNYTPPPPKVMFDGITTNPPSDSDVLVLPKVTVREKAPPRFDPLMLMRADQLAKKYAKDYKDSLKGLDALLNGFSIPLFGPSLASRGAARYRASQMADLDQVITTGKASDPKTSGELQQAVKDMNEAQDWQNRVTGGK